MSKGKVKDYDANRGCGTIIDSATGQSLPVYANYISSEQGAVLQEGQEVEFEIQLNRNNSWAINVRIAQEI